ncbi:PIN domain-containing protein [Leptospira kanakyensis]|uniref:PIN domain-containing protein n=1 Tax=Leptospira kanakyensis TaxID=2484968 RepID=A0A6N4QHI7_9LEPT|nr:PIN domain-containing protein [Leptospira kanakyensis]MCW7471682.1 PIN domain-containing protein [Leptospira kanakyensis]MCW7483265.1 PIN domain-containing protein [Leptospira kanakyensis]TGK51136.1 PIN domain-containing protein [Leptospira kanakyensis]TGK56362.1 PIN domain-containing protein [Leptospira kanakyensis]TGK71108.1 PIN domain-containing protein [Leptospira kanakyensis]
MALYIDSSFLLNIIYSEINSDKYLEIFNSHEKKFSSILLEIETYRSINLFYNLNRKLLNKAWLNEYEGTLNEFLAQISLKNVDFDVQSEIKKNRNILELKSLDATHLATAIHFRKMISENLIICTLDDKFRTVSKKFEFNILPKSITK